MQTKFLAATLHSGKHALLSLTGSATAPQPDGFWIRIKIDLQAFNLFMFNCSSTSPDMSRNGLGMGKVGSNPDVHVCLDLGAFLAMGNARG